MEVYNKENLIKALIIIGKRRNATPNELSRVLSWVDDVPTEKVFTYYKNLTNDQGRTNNTGAYFTQGSLPFNVPTQGKYEISLNYTWSYNSTGSDFEAVLDILDNTGFVEIFKHQQEPKDSSGTGVDYPSTIQGVTLNSGTNQMHVTHFQTELDLDVGNRSLNFSFRNVGVGVVATVHRFSLTIKQVG